MKQTAPQRKPNTHMKTIHAVFFILLCEVVLAFTYIQFRGLRRAIAEAGLAHTQTTHHTTP